MYYTYTSFLLLFAVLVVVVRCLPLFARPPLLTVISLVLIATWGWVSLGVFLLAVLAGYGFSLAVATQGAYARRILGVAIAFNLGLLIFFKYRTLLFAGITPAWFVASTGQLGIPLGVSFYVFHITSYLVDISKGRYRPARFGHYLFYLSFFPHVISGPIVRGWQLLPQIGRARRFGRDMLFGSHLFITGFFLKTVCADNIGPIIDPFWQANGPALTRGEHWLVGIYYYFQIYADFAGYSLMASGMARLLGYRFPINFRLPMSAKSFQEFWRRWHITLSSWLRDYLYIPLGGNRCGAIRNYANLLMVMALGGLWHGAAWTFLAWGFIHGAALCVERLLQAGRFVRWKRLAWWPVTQATVIIAWVFFRAPNLEFATHFMNGMLHDSAKGVHDHGLLPGFVFGLPIIAHHFMPAVMRLLGTSRVVLGMGILSGLLLLASLIIKSPPSVFIYFAF
jgi:alginate O-acetyltransferase complex protein AlgI